MRLAKDAVMIINEEGRLRGLPVNRAFGRSFFGAIVVVGCKGDEFCSLPSVLVPYILRAMKEDEA